MLRNYLLTIQKGLDFKGRATRTEYWTFIGLTLLCNVLIIALSFLFSYITSSKSFTFQTISEMPNVLTIFLAFLLIYNITLIIPGIAVSVRRLHDANMSGWWYLVTLVPQVGTLIFIVFSLLPSVNEANKYGSLEKNEVENSLASDEEVIAVVEDETSIARLPSQK